MKDNRVFRASEVNPNRPDQWIVDMSDPAGPVNPDCYHYFSSHKEAMLYSKTQRKADELFAKWKAARTKAGPTTLEMLASIIEAEYALRPQPYRTREQNMINAAVSERMARLSYYLKG